MSVLIGKPGEALRKHVSQIGDPDDLCENGRLDETSYPATAITNNSGAF